ncbi:MAG: hypothetical protein JEZ02_07060 [Desulfatibacillum sp.]|nr:hypothetical protein [Desulfatibacillum sp.]
MAGLSKWKKIGIACGAGALALIILVVFIQSQSSNGSHLPDTPAGYVFDKTYDAPLADIVKSHGVASPGESFNQTAAAEPGQYSQISLINYFDEGLGVTIFTRKYFKYLEKKFKHSKDLETHLAEVKEFLLAQLPEAEALELFALYENYLSCEMDLAQAQKSWGAPTSVDEVVAMLARMQAYRRDYLGKDVADALFGAEIKTKEYKVRRGAIVADRELYGEEKEALLNDLNDAMWGDQSQAVEAYGLPYNRYQEKLKMYQRDFSELESEEEKTELTREFREQYFEPEQVAALEEVDAMLEDQERAEETFLQQKQAIQDDPGLTQEQKNAAIENTAQEILGEDAPAYFRRQAIEEGKKAMMEKRG